MHDLAGGNSCLYWNNIKGNGVIKQYGELCPNRSSGIMTLRNSRIDPGEFT